MLKVLESAGPVVCWSCSVAHKESTLFCPHCSKIQSPPGVDFFSVFGIEPRLNLDLAALEREFHRLSRKLHPDRFARAQENEKQWSLADTALINDAYRTLKDPLRRTEYLLKLRGAETGQSETAEARQRTEPARVPADLLEEVFNLNMQFEEMRMERKMGREDAQLKENLIAAKLGFAGRVDEVDHDLRAAWSAWDSGDAVGRRGTERAMAALLDRRRYLSNLVRDLTEVLGE